MFDHSSYRSYRSYLSRAAASELFRFADGTSAKHPKCRLRLLPARHEREKGSVA